jgi:hypothetical protein
MLTELSYFWIIAKKEAEFMARLLGTYVIPIESPFYP